MLLKDNPYFKALGDIINPCTPSDLCKKVLQVNGNISTTKEDGTDFVFNVKKIDATVTSFLTMISRFVFDKFSNVHYPRINWYQSFNRTHVPRPNHGAGNHMRQLYFCIIMVHTLMKHNPDAFYGVLNIDNQSKLSQSDLLKRYLALLAAGLFQQISRISETETIKFSVPRKMDETGKETYRHLYKFIMGDTANEAFVSEFDNVMYIGVQQLVSYTIYKIMMKQLLDPKDNDKKINSFINHVTASALYYMMDIKSGPHISTDIRCNLYLMNELIAGGHYMDHCRGNYSMFFEHNSALYYLYVLSLNKDVSIGSIVDEMEAIVLHTLVNTSDLTGDVNGIECIKKNMKYKNAKTKRSYSNTDDRIKKLTNFEILFHDILFTEFRNKAELKVTINTRLNETLQRFYGQTFEFDLSSDLKGFLKR